MDFFLGHLLLTFLQAHYPGGTEEFQRKGGQIQVVPSKSPEVIVYIPDEDFDVDKVFNGLSSKLKMNVVHTRNFQDMDDNEMQEHFSREGQVFLKNHKLVKPQRIDVTIGRVCVTAFVTDKALAEEYLKFLNNVDGLIRARVVYPEGVFAIDPEREERQALVEPEQPKREQAIGDDDITNLKILLETSNSLEDFLDKI